MFYITDERMDNHFCPWETDHIEVPERLKAIREEIENSGELSEAIVLTARSAAEEEVLSIHTREYFDKIKSTKNMTVPEIEVFCSQYEDIYLNKDSFDLSMLSAGCALELTRNVWESKSCGFAAVRPPGHHAFPNAGCGFCIFNNVAICAKQAQKWGAKKVLIVDWDVHAGQGTQECIEGNEDIRLISIHRYQNGTFWPNLEQSAVKHQFSNTLNIPLNETGLGDIDYLAIVQLLVMPLIQDFKPDLILVSCGFDAALGDPEGEMKVSPAGFAAMTKLLLSTKIPLAMILEGGYFLDSIRQDALSCIKALKQKPVPQIPIVRMKLECMKTLLVALEYYSSSDDKYPNLRQTFEIIKFLREEAQQEMPAKVNEFQGTRDCPIPFPTRNVYTLRPESENEKFRAELRRVCEELESQPENRKLFKMVPSEDLFMDYSFTGNVLTFMVHKHFFNFFNNAVMAPLSFPSLSLSDSNSLAAQNIGLQEFCVSLSKLLTNPTFQFLPFLQIACSTY